MAKKPLTPEQAEIKAMKKAKKSENWTKFWAVLLAAVLTFAVVSMGKTAAEDAIEKAKEQNQTEDVGSNNTTDNNNTTTTPGGNTTTTPDAPGGSTTTPDAPGGNTNAPAGDSEEKAKAITVLNSATAAAAKKSYTWERKCYFTEPLDVGDKTEDLNGIIQKVDPNANIDTVVGGFIGRTGEKDDPAWTAQVTNGKRPAEGTKMNDDKYLMIATKLTESDVASCTVDGNKYTFNLVTCNNPQKDGKNALNHVTNDFITLGEVQKGVKDGLGALSFLLSVDSLEVAYESIVVTAEIKDGNLVSFGVSYHMNVKSLKLSIAEGKGAGDMICTYKNFK